MENIDFGPVNYGLKVVYPVKPEWDQNRCRAAVGIPTGIEQRHRSAEVTMALENREILELIWDRSVDGGLTIYRINKEYCLVVECRARICAGDVSCPSTTSEPRK